MSGAEIVRRNFRQYDRDNGQAGIYTPSTPGASWTSVAVNASQAKVGRFVPSRNMRIVNIAFGVATAAGADDACDVGIYDAAWNRLVSSGATTGKLNATGRQAVAITPTVVKAGQVYYSALSVGTLGGTAASLGCVTLNNTNLISLFGSTAGFIESTGQNTAHPLPATFTGGVANQQPFLLALLES